MGKPLRFRKGGRLRRDHAGHGKRSPNTQKRIDELNRQILELNEKIERFRTADLIAQRNILKEQISRILRNTL